MATSVDTSYSAYVVLCEKVEQIIKECDSEEELRSRLDTEGITHYGIEWVDLEGSKDGSNQSTFETFMYTEAKSGNMVKVKLDPNSHF